MPRRQRWARKCKSTSSKTSTSSEHGPATKTSKADDGSGSRKRNTEKSKADEHLPYRKSDEKTDPEVKISSGDLVTRAAEAKYLEDTMAHDCIDKFDMTFIKCKYGLKNHGNDCFAIAPLQCLLSEFAIATTLSNMNCTTDVKTKEFVLHKAICGSLKKYSLHFLREFYQDHDSSTIKNTIFKELIDTFWITLCKYEENKQHDAPEFLQRLITFIISNTSAKLHDLLFYEHFSQAECKKCHKPILDSEGGYILGLGIGHQGIKKSNSLQKCIDFKMGKNHTYKCLLCGEPQNQLLAREMLLFPKYLFLQLNRFTMEREKNMKDRRKVHVDNEIVVSGCRYDMQSVVTHLGQGDLCSGHYVSHMKYDQEVFIFVNDDKVSLMDTSAVQEYIERDAYLILYKKVEAAQEGENGDKSEATNCVAISAPSKNSAEISSLPRRILKETQRLMQEPVPGISAVPDDNNARYFHVIVTGPEDSPFEGGLFKLELFLPEDYPMSAPKVRFITKIYHPNIDRLGRIGLNILKDNWGAAMQIRTVLLSIQALLSAPNPDDPLENDVAELWKANEAEAIRNAKEWTRRYAMDN